MTKTKVFGDRVKLFYGENSFEINLEIEKNKLLAKENQFSVQVIDGQTLNLEKMIDLLGGVSLFCERKLIIIKNLSQNSEIWLKMTELFSRISDETVLILIEGKLDKRIKVTKDLLKKLDSREFKNRSNDVGELANLAVILAKNQGLKISDDQARFLVDYIGGDEWAIKQAIDRLSLMPPVTEDKIRKYLPHNQEANVFSVLQKAIDRQPGEVQLAMNKLKTSSDDEGYRFFGLISTQIFNISALKVGLSNGLTVSEIAKKIGANSWSLNQLKQLVQALNFDELENIILDFSTTDEILKSSNADIWELQAALLFKIATR